MTNKIFISYARSDSDYVSGIVSALRELGLNVFWDQDIAPGSDYDEVLRKEIRESALFLVLWSSDSANSTGVKAEVEKANYYRERGENLEVIGVYRENNIDLPLYATMSQAFDLSDEPKAPARSKNWPAFLGFLSEYFESNLQKSEPKREEDWLSRAFEGGRVARFVFITSALVSTVATFSGLYSFARINFDLRTLDFDDLIVVMMGFLVVCLTVGMMLIVNTLATSRTRRSMLAMLVVYMVAVTFSVGFGYAFYWRIVAAPAAADREVRNASDELRSGLSAYQSELTAFVNSLDLSRQFSDGKQRVETDLGGSCDNDPNPSPGFGPRARMRAVHTEQVSSLIESIESDWVLGSVDRTQTVTRLFDEFRLASTGVRGGIEFDQLVVVEQALLELAATENGLLNSRKDTISRELRSAASEIRDNGICRDEELAEKLEDARSSLLTLAPLSVPNVDIPRGAEAVSAALSQFWLNVATSLRIVVANSANKPFNFNDFVALFLAIMVDLGLLVSGILYSSAARRHSFTSARKA